jgi:hypothetical protein
VINRSVVILASLVIGYLFCAAWEYAFHSRIGHVVPLVTIGVSAAFSALYAHLMKRRIATTVEARAPKPSTAVTARWSWAI